VQNGITHRDADLSRETGSFVLSTDAEASCIYTVHTADQVVCICTKHAVSLSLCASLYDVTMTIVVIAITIGLNEQHDCGVGHLRRY